MERYSEQEKDPLLITGPEFTTGAKDLIRGNMNRKFGNHIYNWFTDIFEGKEVVENPSMILQYPRDRLMGVADVVFLRLEEEEGIWVYLARHRTYAGRYFQIVVMHNDIKIDELRKSSFNEETDYSLRYFPYKEYSTYEVGNISMGRETLYSVFGGDIVPEEMICEI